MTEHEDSDQAFWDALQQADEQAREAMERVNQESDKP
jgi:hypothetical protein